jgi:hypothetical protein
MLSQIPNIHRNIAGIFFRQLAIHEEILFRFYIQIREKIANTKKTRNASISFLHCTLTYTGHTHTHIYIYIYIYIAALDT